MRLSSQHRRTLVLAGALVLLAATMTLVSEHFLTGANLLGMTRHLAEVGIIACGMTLIVMTGGIDLSVGSLLALCSIVLGYASHEWGLGLGVGVAMAFGVGALGGALNGFLVTRGGFPPLVATLGTMALYRGLALRVSEAQPVSGFPQAFEWLGQGHVGPVPVQTLLWAGVATITALAVARTPIGPFTRAVGDNERAARFAALPVDGVKLGLYTGTGLLVAVGALVSTARFSTARADAGTGLELEVVAAVVLGGTAITGGRGSVLGTVLGVLILGVARNGLVLAGVEQEWRSMMTGAILIAAAISDQWMARRDAARASRPAPAAATEAS